MTIYAMSDIHGFIGPFEEALARVDLSDKTSRLILLGDYCDRGPASLAVYRKIMRLQEEFPDKVVALRGNHEEMLLEYIDMASVDLGFTQGWMLADVGLKTAQSFLDETSFAKVKHLLARKKFEDAYRMTADCMKTRHADIIRWIRGLPYYYESEFKQVFCHAGIDEDAGDLWRVGTPAEYFTSMSPYYNGKHFELDVIAGHISTEFVSEIPGYCDIWFDGASHYYIDGHTVTSGRIPVLEYDEATGTYSGPGL
ncbi:MAG: metallophosphoesterase [Slackia sp.]|nr:metallophosphoesterase [Slackia sp.]